MNSLLPTNASAGELALEAATARIADVPTPRDLWNPQTCPEALLPWLAWAVGVVNWSSDWSADERRAAIAQAIRIRRHRGTIGAVRRALSVLDYGMDVREWFALAPAGAPGTFELDVEITGKPVDASLYDDVTRIVNASKNLRSHLTTLRLIGAVAGGLFAGARVYGGAAVTVEPYSVTDASIESPIFMAASMQRIAIVQINPAD